jgi:tetratricopeptide (TPR) repeat protein
MIQNRPVQEKHLAQTARFVVLAMILAAGGPLRAQQGEALAETTKALYRGNAVQAASLARRYLKVHPGTPAALILLARAEMAQEKYESAYQSLWRVLSNDPKNIDALYYLAQVCVKLSQQQREELYSLAPDSARVHQLLAESYRVQHNRAKAEEEYLAALRADPRSVEVLNALGDLERSQFRFDEAASHYSQATRIERRDFHSAYGLGVCYLYQQSPARAIEEFRRALVLDSESAPARLALGDALLRVGQVAEAVAELKTAATLEPEMRQAYTLLARAYRRLGQSREAQEALRKSEELSQKERLAREEDFVTDGLAPAVSPNPED